MYKKTKILEISELEYIMKTLKSFICVFIFAHVLIMGLDILSINLFCIYIPTINRVYAEELTGFNLNGYATISATSYDRSDMFPVRDISQNPDNKFKTQTSAVMDSRLGLQAHYRFNQNFDAVVQGVLRDQAYVTFKNSLESAFLAYRPNTWIELRAGRIGFDAFLMADTRNLGYAYSWVRPPTEFYGWIPIFHLDGADATFRFEEEESQWRVRLQTGNQGFTFSFADSEYDSKIEEMKTITVSRQAGNLLLKTGYSKIPLKNELDVFMPLHEGLDAIADATAILFPEISDEARYLRKNLAFHNTDLTYFTIGASYDDGKWIAQVELARSKSTAEVLSHGTMGYAALGYRIGDFTPYFIFSAIRPGNNLREPIADWSLIEASELQETANNIINTSRMDQETLSYGIRWDFHNQAAVKFQLDSVRISPFGQGLWFARTSTFDHESSVTLGTLSLEVMF